MQGQNQKRYRIENYVKNGDRYSCDVPEINKKCLIRTVLTLTKKDLEDFVNKKIWEDQEVKA